MHKSKYEPYRELILSAEASSETIAQTIAIDCSASSIRTAKRRFLKYKDCKNYNLKWRKQNRTQENVLDRIRRTCDDGSAINNNSQWTTQENELVLNKDLTCRQIAQKLGRTIDAVYTQRVRLKKAT